MSDPYIGEIRPFALTYTPRGWLTCDGSKANLQQNQALFAVIGNLYGPTDNRTYFTLPNLLGQATMHWGVPQPGWPYAALPTVGQTYGDDTVTATLNNFAPHTHTVQMGAAGAAVDLTDEPKLALAYRPYYAPTKTTYPAWSANPPSTAVTMPEDTISTAGQNQPAAHENRQPFQVFRFCIACEGVFPVTN